MAQSHFLTLEQILLIHEDQIERYGGSSGLRDRTLLESALYRPQATFGGEDLYPTIFQKAAALMFSLINNHAFVDGNKRTGMVSGMVFLEMNRYSLIVPQKEIVTMALSIHKKKYDIEGLASRLEEHSEVVSG